MLSAGVPLPLTIELAVRKHYQYQGIQEIYILAKVREFKKERVDFLKAIEQVLSDAKESNPLES